MTRKHFEKLAYHLKFAHPGLDAHDTPAARIAWAESVRAVADACAESNPAFKRGRFLSACTPAGRVFV